MLHSCDVALLLAVQVLMEDILPALERLRKEKAAYNQYQAAQDTLDRLIRFVAAHRYVTAQQSALLVVQPCTCDPLAVLVGLWALCSCLGGGLSPGTAVRT